MLATTLFSVILCSCSQATPATGTNPPALTAPTETAAQRDARMAWWRDARCGMFIHWGAYSTAGGRWNGKPTEGVGEWLLTNAKIPVDQYEPLQAQFNPVKFDANEWVRIAKDAGMRYIVITSKHHDGFCLWDSELTDWDIMGSPFKRDALKELATACQAAGIRLCFYHSIMDWHHPDYLPRRSWDTRSTEGAEYARYVQYMKGQLKELLSGEYGDVGIVWFDGEWESTWTHELGKDLDAFVRTLAPKAIVNNRVDKGRKGMAGMTAAGDWVGDYGTPEQEVPANGFPGVDWETCMTMNDTWGWKVDDHHWKSESELIRMMCDIASKGGNFLLNVGPTGEGVIPPESVERLAAMGRWNAAHPGVVHGSQASPFPALAWGRCTQRDLGDGTTQLNLIVFDWPTDGRLIVPGLANEIVSSELMGGGAIESVGRSADGRDVVFAFPAGAKPPNAIASVVRLVVKGAPKVGP